MKFLRLALPLFRPVVTLELGLEIFDESRCRGTAGRQRQRPVHLQRVKARKAIVLDHNRFWPGAWMDRRDTRSVERIEDLTVVVACRRQWRAEHFSWRDVAQVLGATSSDQAKEVHGL